MKQYLELIQNVLSTGIDKKDRTGTGTISKFGYQMRFNLQEGFPIVTTKKVHFKSAVYELLWFIKGDTNIKYLVDHDVRIWNEWPYEKYKKNVDSKISMDEFISLIKNDNVFAKKYGDLGPVYGKQWRNFNNVDQLDNLLKNLKNDPYSRRHIISSWNPSEINEMALPPCHTLMQFYVAPDHTLSCQLYQRSADIFLGVPFNIVSYALLTHLIAQTVGLQVGDFVHTLGDCHIYHNHLEQVRLQLSREPLSLPKLILNKEVSNLYDFSYEDIKLDNYQSHGLIKGKVAV